MDNINETENETKILEWARGRKPKLTEELIEEAYNLLLNGYSRSRVCDYLGVSERTFYRWLEDGEKAKTGIKSHFCQCIKRAEAEAEFKYINIINKASQENYQAATWILERRSPKIWGRKDEETLQAELDHKEATTKKIKTETAILKGKLEDIQSLLDNNEITDAQKLLKSIADSVSQIKK